MPTTMHALSFRAGLTLLLACLLLVPASSTSAPTRAAEEPWRLVSDKNGIQVYMRHTDDSPVKTFRGVTRFRMENLHAISAVMNDTPNMPQWMHFVDQARELSRRDYLHRELQFLTNLPWPVTDREALVNVDVSYDVPGNKVFIRAGNNPTALPPNPDYVRFPQFNARFDFTGDPATREVEVTYEVIADLGGYIPPWLVNVAMKDVPYFTLERFRRVVLKPEYQNWRDPVIPFPW
jgi:hypothetical protein